MSKKPLYQQGPATGGMSPEEVGLIRQPIDGSPEPADINDLEGADDIALLDPDELKQLVLHRLDEEQANEIVTIELAGKSDVADAMIIASGRSHRHVGAIAQKLAADLKKAGASRVAVEGLPAADWVLLDAGDIVVHLFRPEVRSFYNLERIWAPELFGEDAPEGGADFVPATDAVAMAADDGA